MDNMGNVNDSDLEPSNVDIKVTSQRVNEEEMKEEEEEEEAQVHAEPTDQE
jgi:hypothetical protein